MDEVVKATDLSVNFGKTKALDRVNISLKAGRIIGFIGPSGAGKTTLIRTIVGRHRPNSGKVLVLGQPAGSQTLRSRLSYMTQENSVYPDLSVKQNLTYFAIMHGLKRTEAKKLIDEILVMMEMTNQTKQLARSLSGGQKQRLSLAIALIGSPELLVLDEPTVGLDPLLRDQIWKTFRALVKQGKNIIISSHVMDEAERCDDLVLIRDGKVLAHDSPQGLCRATNSTTVEQSFLKLVEREASK